MNCNKCGINPDNSIVIQIKRLNKYAMNPVPITSSLPIGSSQLEWLHIGLCDNCLFKLKRYLGLYKNSKLQELPQEARSPKGLTKTTAKEFDSAPGAK